METIVVFFFSAAICTNIIEDGSRKWKKLMTLHSYGSQIFTQSQHNTGYSVADSVKYYLEGRLLARYKIYVFAATASFMYAS